MAGFTGGTGINLTPPPATIIGYVPMVLKVSFIFLLLKTDTSLCSNLWHLSLEKFNLSYNVLQAHFNFQGIVFRQFSIFIVTR